jgi:DNA-binding PadR family transcriptional regulator
MRLLFGGNASFIDLLQGSQLNRLEIVNILGRLQRNGDVKKEKIPILGGNKRTRSSYRLTHTGERKLALFEYRDALYKQWSPVSQNLARPYVQEINKIIIQNGYFGHPPQEA